MVQRTESNSLDCSSFEERIHQLLDDRLTLTGDQRLMDHAQQCAECNSLLEDFDSVDDSVSMLQSEIEAAINQRLTEQAADRHTSRLGWIVALAATLLLFVGMIRSESDHRQKTTARSVPVKVSSAPRLGVAGLGKTKEAAQSIVRKTRVRKQAPLTSPFNRDFSLADQLPRVPTVPTWQDISKRFENLESVIVYSSEIPGVRPVQCSLSVTLDLIMSSFTRSEPNDHPDLGLYEKSFQFACV